MPRVRLRVGRRRGTHGLVVVGCALALTCLAGGCTGSDTEESNAALYVRDVSGNVFPDQPVRGPFKPLRYERGSFSYRCSECHKDFDTLVPRGDLRGEHADIDAKLNHGSNTRCLNCHHPDNRNAYADHGGGEIPATQPARLCGKCHGTIYRDWKVGVHGRSNGYWDTSIGARERLLCIQCHDPHDPAFKPMHPDPPPIHSRLAAQNAKEVAHEH